MAATCGLVLLGQELGLWEPALLPATVAWILTQGVVLLYKLGTRDAGEAFFRPTLAQMLHLTWLIEVFMGFYVLGIPTELVLLVAVGLLGAMSAFAEGKEDYLPTTNSH